MSEAVGARLVILAVLASCGPRARWTAADTFVEVAVAGTIAVDYVQTRRIINEPIRPYHREWNPVLARGVHPEVYFPAALALHVAAARMLRQPYRRILQVVTLGLQFRAIENNLAYGYAIEW